MLKRVALMMAILALCAPAKSFGFGLEVDPVEINIENAPVGKKIALSDYLGGEKLKIQNKGGVDYTYTINILYSSEVRDSLRKGYTDIPDTSWIAPENKEVYIPAHSAKEVELYLKIPEKREYYNKKYQAILEVKSKKNRPEEIIVLAVQIRACVSTRGQRSEVRGQKSEVRGQRSE